MHVNEQALMATLLKRTSRSFYLTLRMLPAKVRFPIGLAYLLARTSDTIVDTEAVAVDERAAALRDYRSRVLGLSSQPVNFGDVALHQTSLAELDLLRKSEVAISLLATLPPADLQSVHEVFSIITGGQEADLRRFSAASAAAIAALQTDSELDDYTYRVAGCVGEFWTKICRAHLFPGIKLDDRQLLADGVRFGKGLQLVNILRDLPADLRQGRCYLPLARLAEANLTPQDLLSTANEPRFRPLYHAWLDLAGAHLAAGWRYTNTLPRNQIRLRLACAWPILIGCRTLERLRVENVLDPERRIKISRAAVNGVIWRSVLAYPFPGRWNGLFAAGKAVASGAKVS
jgi:farnesyl-diphosphate farnesyltransferase